MRPRLWRALRQHRHACHHGDRIVSVQVIGGGEETSQVAQATVSVAAAQKRR